MLRFDQLLGELRCCRTGNVGLHLLVDGTSAALPSQLVVEGGHMIRGTDTVYKVSDTAACLLHSDGVTTFAGQQIRSLLMELQVSEESVTDDPRLDLALLAQMLFSRNRQPHDDAALCLWSWQRR